MASIRKRTGKKGTTYNVEIRMKGASPQRASFTSLTKAKAWVQSTESAIREGRHFTTTEAKKYTVKQLIEEYKTEVTEKNPKARSQKFQLDYWKDEIGHLVLADVTKKVINEKKKELLKGLTPTGNVRSPATVKRYLAALSSAFTYAIDELELLNENPVSKVPKPTEPKGRVRYLSKDEEIDGEIVEGEKTRLLKACKNSENTYLYTVVVLALSTGMRQGEIMNLKWKDVDIVQGRITLFDTKNGESRAVTLTGKALELVKEHKKYHRRLDMPMLFPSKKGYVLTKDGKKEDKAMNLRKPWVKVLKEAEVEDFHFHDLRHTAASYLAMNNATLHEIAEVLGHKTLTMAMRYTHLSEAHTSSVVAKMNAVMFNE
ncbi:MAG: site-specific integrase [Candidatus Diapherotrites archaeon]|nr:site-specific integrase [Candidatus Diapherotrites archaeon]